MAVTARRQIFRRLIGILPMLAIGVLFLAPAIIWMIKREPPAIEQVRTPGRILEVVSLPTRDAGPADRFTVRLRGGEVIVFETDAAPMPFSPGDDVVVVRMTMADGEVTYSLERE